MCVSTHKIALVRDYQNMHDYIGGQTEQPELWSAM